MSSIGLRHFPLVRAEFPIEGDIYLKLENLQPFGSYKLRGVAHAVLSAPSEGLRHGLVTVSAGNMAQAVAFMARERGLRCTALIPDTTPRVKRQAIENLGAQIIELPFSEIWEIVREGGTKRAPGYLIHPFYNRDLLAGYGGMAPEILEDLPEVETVLIPFGTGGLAIGLASALRAIKPRIKIYACEVETAAPLTAAFAKGAPVAIQRQPSFVDAIGTPEVLPPVWREASRLLDGSITASLDEIKETIRFLFSRHRIVAEGAGAASLACAFKEKTIKGKTVCIISGGNIDSRILLSILDVGI